MFKHYILNLKITKFTKKLLKIKFQQMDKTDLTSVNYLQEIEYNTKKESITIKNFLLLSVIGKGSYAKVILVKKKDTGNIYAIKILKKDYIEKRNQTSHVKIERNILVFYFFEYIFIKFINFQVNIKHPFIIKLAYAFQNEKKLFFALEYCPGGELFYLL